jgi:putative exporter of polyketide antibiotics
VTACTILIASAWLGWIIPADRVGFALTPADLLMGVFPLLVVSLLFAALALLLSLVLPSSQAASAVSGGLLVANFLLVGISNLNDDLKPLYEVTPLYYFQGARFIDDPNWTWMLGLIGAALLLAVLAWALFLRRDIRVGGEAGWQLPWLGRKRQKAG